MERRPFRFGIALKLLITNAVVVILVAIVSIWQASTQLQRTLRRNFESKGEAIALSLAAASERSIGSDASSIQASIDSNKVIEGVKYVFVTDRAGHVQTHTFSPAFPIGLERRNEIGLGEVVTDAQGATARVRTAYLEYPTADGMESAIDVAAP